jgi:hypothetical protein
MRDLSNYHEDYLALEVLNDPYFHAEIFNRPYLFALIHEEFIYTDEQMRVLLLDLEKIDEEQFDHENRFDHEI